MKLCGDNPSIGCVPPPPHSMGQPQAPADCAHTPSIECSTQPGGGDEPTFGQMAEHPSGTLGNLAPSWTVDAPSVGIGVALTLLIGLAVVAARRLRQRHVTSPKAPAVEGVS